MLQKKVAGRPSIAFFFFMERGRCGAESARHTHVSTIFSLVGRIFVRLLRNVFVFLHGRAIR